MNEALVTDTLKSRAAALQTLTRLFTTIMYDPPKGITRSLLVNYLTEGKAVISESVKLEYTRDLPIDNYYKSSVILNIGSRLKQWDTLSDSNKLLLLYQLSIYIRISTFVVAVSSQDPNQEVNFRYEPYLYKLLLLEDVELTEKEYKSLTVILMRIMKLEQE